MSYQPLATAMSATFEQLDDLSSRHRDAEAYDAAVERLAYVHGRVQHLREMLAELRAATLMAQVASDTSAGNIWRQTCADLRAAAPAALWSPGRALVSGNLDLLRVVEYTGAATALAQERRDLVVERIAQRYIVRLCADEGTVVRPAPDDTLRLRAASVIRDIARRQKAHDLESAADVWLHIERILATHQDQ